MSTARTDSNYTEATRTVANTSTLSDLVFVSFSEFVEEHEMQPPFCSDHCDVYVSSKFKNMLYKGNL